MGMIQEDGGGGKEKGGKKRAKKASTHIDMTPMVDLAFLLLTFFMLTTSFSKPTTMEIIMPKKKVEQEQDPKPVDADRVLNILIGEDDKLYYYHGIVGGARAGEITKTDYSANGIRKVLVQKIAEIEAMDKVPMVLIKPVKNAKYKHVVDIFDEMNITEAPSYALVPILEQELEKIQPTNN